MANIANIKTALGKAAGAFDTIIAHPDIDRSSRLSARGLRERIGEKIAQLTIDQGWVEDSVKVEVYHYLHGIIDAVAVTDFTEAVRQGDLMLDALPGEGQTDQKPPWEE